MAYKILVTVPFTEEQKAVFREAAVGFQDEIIFTHAPKEIEEQMKSADAVIGNVSTDVLSRATKLKWLQLNSSGADKYVKPGILPEGALLTSATGSYGTALSEYMVCMLLVMMKKIPLYMNNQKEGRWKDEGPVTTPAGKRILIVGTGDIGLSFARRIRAFALPDAPITLVGVRRRAGVCPEELDEIHPISALKGEAARADVIAVSLPGTEETYHLFDKNMLLACKKGSFLINVGRGSVIENDALKDPEVYTHFSGMYFDVFEKEPLPDNDLLYHIPGLYVTPHICGDFHLDLTLQNIADIALHNYKAFHGEGEYRSVIDMSTGYAG